MNNIENLKDLIIYQSQNNENISVEVLYNEEDFWLTQKSMSKLFNVAENNITYHLQNIFKTKELEQDSVTQKIRVTASDGKKYNTNFYSLDAIIAVGYRVNSKEATDFRIWATNTLKEYIKKGFVVNSEMLKNGPKFGKDYFDELLVKIKEIRASERRFYQKITDIYKECSFDYDKNSETTQEFYKNVQNKLHFAITGMTAPEIIYNRVDSKKENMGLTTWKNAPDGKILETDVVTGCTSKGMGTPELVCYVYGKSRNAILRGANYRSFVNYWVPVYGGIGIHDATWRDEFGGELYKKSGSHGCVNTPLEKMEELYDMLEIGMPVVIHY